MCSALTGWRLICYSEGGERSAEEVHYSRQVRWTQNNLRSIELMHCKMDDTSRLTNSFSGLARYNQTEAARAHTHTQARPHAHTHTHKVKRPAVIFIIMFFQVREKKKKKKSNRVTASVLKQDPNTKRFKRTLIYLSRTHSMHIFGEIPFIKPQNDA